VPRLVGALLNTLEGLVVRAATVTLVPEEFRRTALPRWCHSKVEVVRNSPIDPGFADPAMLEDAGLGRILYGGWLDWGRGLRQMVEVVGTTPGLSLDVAGEGNPEIVAFLAGRKGVRYLGYLSHTEILRLTGESGFVSALYDPARPINRLAASNKLAEGLAVGRPVIINSELEIAKALSGYGCLVEAPYLELGDLGAKIVELIGDRERYEGMCRAGRRAYETLYAWEEVREAARRVVKRVG
jgi:glycosyltransferase involved in cell wall biosynthesis